MNDKLQEVAELRAHMEGLPVSVVIHVHSETTATGNITVSYACPTHSLPRPIQAEVISGASTLLRTTEPAMEVKDGSMQRRELILFTDQYVLRS